MFKKIEAGRTSVMIPVRAYDTSSSTGAYLTGLTSSSSGLVGRYRREGASSWTSITIVSATAGTFTSGGWAVPTSGPTGSYEVHVPNAAFASGAKWVEIEYSGVTNMQPISMLIELDAVNYQDATAFGLSRIDAAVSSRLASASYTAPANSDIAAIKAKTDNLPSDPADASDIASSFSTVNSKLDAIDDFVDTEIAAIKSVTDKLDTALALDGSVYQFTVNALENAPSGGGGGGLDAAGVRTAIGLASANLDTQLTNIKNLTTTIIGL